MLLIIVMLSVQYETINKAFIYNDYVSFSVCCKDRCKRYPTGGKGAAGNPEFLTLSAEKNAKRGLLILT